MRSSDWSSDVCSSDLISWFAPHPAHPRSRHCLPPQQTGVRQAFEPPCIARGRGIYRASCCNRRLSARKDRRSEEHTSELQSLMRISYAVFCLKQTKVTLQLRPQTTLVKLEQLRHE